MPKRIGITQAQKKEDEPKPKPKPERPVHKQGLYKFGDKVRVTGTFDGDKLPSGFTATWNNSMRWLVGKVGIVHRNAWRQGYVVRFKNGQEWNWPSTCLELAKPKRRVRVKPDGTWDAAPCTHLRWHLMGFFRENLAIVRAEGGPTEVDIKCTKCNTTMTMKTKGE